MRSLHLTWASVFVWSLQEDLENIIWKYVKPLKIENKVLMFLKRLSSS